MGHPPGRYRIWFYHDCTPPTTSLQLLLCLWTWGIFFFGGGVGGEFFQHPPVDGCSTASCNFGSLTRGDDCTSFYSAILNRKSRLRVLNYNIRLSFTHTQKKSATENFQEQRLLSGIKSLRVFVVWFNFFFYSPNSTHSLEVPLSENFILSQRYEEMQEWQLDVFQYLFFLF